MTSLLFFTCADAGYEDFAPLYIASALWSVGDARAEVGLVSADAFAAANPEAIRVLTAHFGDRFLIRDVPWQRDGKKVLPHTVRFLNEPLTHADNVYIGDIDIIYLDRNFPAQHLAFMETMNVPYANSRRTGTGRMTGLHFTKWEAMYPLPDLSDLDLLRENDENVLGMICDRKGLPQHDKMWRPVPGIHVSPNREPISVADAEGKRKPDWGIRNWVKAYGEFRASDLMKALYPALKGKAKSAIDAIDDALAQQAAAAQAAAPRPEPVAGTTAAT